MKHILIIGATGQIGSELTMELRRRYGNTNVVAGYIQGAEPKGELKESGPSAVVDVTNGEMIESVVKEYHIDTIYNLAGKLVLTDCGMFWKWRVSRDVRYLPPVLSDRSVQARLIHRHHRILSSVPVLCMESPR